MDKIIKFLITRPIDEALEMSELLKKRKISYEVCPLLKIKKIKNKINFEPDIIIFTSKNAVRNYVHSKNNKSYLNVYTIGDETKALAREKGYKRIISVNGDEKSLINNLKKIVFKNMKILHPTSQIKNEYLKNFFNMHYCIYTPVCCYKSDKINSAPQRFKKFIKLKKHAFILIFSSRTAESFCDEILKYNLSNFCENKNVIVLSSNIKKKLDLINFNEILVTSRPNLDSMIKSIELIVKEEKQIERI